MAARVSETYVLRTYPFRESDLIVSFFTRDQGKLRGVARRSSETKKHFWVGTGTTVSRESVVFAERNAGTGKFELLRVITLTIRSAF